MSWDVSLYKFSRNYATLDEIPDNEQPSALGTRGEVQAAIAAVFPGTDWKDPVWGIFESAIGSIEFNVGQEDPVRSITLHVRAQDEIVDGILELCSQEGWQAIDLTSSTFLERAASPASGLRKWRSYVARVLGRGDA